MKSRLTSVRIDAEDSTINFLLHWARRRLHHLETAPLDSEVLLDSLLGQGREYLYSHPELALPAEKVRSFSSLVARRAEGYPVPYLTGCREFWSVEYKVTRDTLIPRPETEVLVETALRFIPTDQACRILDLGTGCGTVAIAIARERPLSLVTATDISMEALTIAMENAARNDLGNIEWLRSDWFSNLSERRFDLLVSNPPYVESADSGFTKGLRFEPRLALDGGRTGLDALRRIIPAATHHLQPGGRVLVEHGHNQGPEVRRLFGLNRYLDITTSQDLAMLDRVTMGHRPA